MSKHFVTLSLNVEFKRSLHVNIVFCCVQSWKVTLKSAVFLCTGIARCSEDYTSKFELEELTHSSQEQIDPSDAYG